jgi:hypothetical protein
MSKMKTRNSSRHYCLEPSRKLRGHKPSKKKPLGFRNSGYHNQVVIHSLDDQEKEPRDCAMSLTPKRQSPFFGLFLKFGEAIVDAIFVKRISNFVEHVV